MASSLLRAVVDGCSTTGRSLLPAVGFQFIGGPAALWTQERGMAKKANRRVEVCLLQDIEKLGRDGEVVKVKPGRARNHLVPYKMAAYATEERLAEAALKRASWAVDEEAMDADEDHVKKETRTACKILSNAKLVIKCIVNKETNQPRRPITAKLLADEILRQRKVEVDVKTLRMEKGPLSTFGDHTVPLWIDKLIMPEERALTVSLEKKRRR